MNNLFLLTARTLTDDIITYILLIFTVIFCIFFIRRIKIYNQAFVLFSKNDYSAVIAMRKKLDCRLFYRNGIINNGFYMLAMAYFETGDDEHFLYYMDKVKNKSVLSSKYYILAIHALMTNNGQADLWKEKLSTLHEDKYDKLSLYSLEAIMDFLTRKEYNPVFAENIVYFCRSDRVIRFLTEKRTAYQVKMCFNP